MLKRENRLKKRYQYNYVYKVGKKLGGASITVYVATSKTKNIKVGFCVTKKIGKATKRNLVRRRLREIAKKQLPKLKQNYNIIIVAKDNILSTTFADLAKEFETLLKKLEMFNEKDI